MKIGIEACGGPQGLPTDPNTCYKGQATHLRSEGTYILEQALNLARHGIDVEYRCETWGTPDVPNHLHIVNTIKDCDVLISAGNISYNEIDTNLHLHFWGSGPWDIKPDERDVFLHGYKFLKPMWKEIEYGMYAPHPIFNKQSKPNVDSTNTLWANRGSFFNKQYAFESEPLLQILEAHSEFHHTILLFNDIREEGGNIIAERFINLPNRTLIEPLSGVDHDKFIQLLSKSKFLMSFIRQQCAPTPIEAVAYGAIPFIYSEVPGHFGNISNEFNFDGFKTEKLFTNDELFVEYHTALATEIIDHSHNAAFNILMSGIKERL